VLRKGRLTKAWKMHEGPAFSEINRLVRGHRPMLGGC
jgi:hypothetical protein